MLAVGAAVLGGSAVQAQTHLRYKFEQGETLKYVLEQKNDIQMNVQGKDIKMVMGQKVYMTWNVVHVDDKGISTIKQTMDRILFSMDLPQGKVDWDSDSKAEPEGEIAKMMVPAMKAMVGAEFQLKMNEQGKITEFQVPEKVTEALKNIPGAGSSMVSPESFKQMATQGNLVLPKEEVAKGKSWHNKTEAKMPFGIMKVDYTFTYAGTADKGGTELQKITISPTVALEPKDDAPFTLKLKSSKGEGSAYFDNEAGCMAEMHMAQVMEMNVVAQGQTIEQTMKTTTTLKRQQR